MARKSRFLGGTGPEGSGWRIDGPCGRAHRDRFARRGSRAGNGTALRNQIGGAAQIEGADNAAAAAQCEIAVLTLPSLAKRYC